MTDKSIHAIAELLENSFPGTYLHKNHQSLVKSLMFYLAPYKAEDALIIIKDYATEYDNAPTIGTIVKLLDKQKRRPQPLMKKNYMEDNDGCGYLYNEQEHDYDCIWKWWWADQGKSKMATLREYGIVNY